MKNREAGFWPGLNRLVETFSLNWSLSSPQQPAPLPRILAVVSISSNPTRKSVSPKPSKNFAWSSARLPANYSPTVLQRVEPTVKVQYCCAFTPKPARLGDQFWAIWLLHFRLQSCKFRTMARVAGVRTVTPEAECLRQPEAGAPASGLCGWTKANPLTV